MQLIRERITDKSGTYDYDVVLLHEFGRLSAKYSDPSVIFPKVQELFVKSRKYPTLFSDYTEGDPEAFITIFFNPRSVWLEIQRTIDSESVGVMCLAQVILNHDATCHLALWDSIFSGREKLLFRAMEWAMERYNLVRLSAEIPITHHGFRGRLTKRLGFKEEGTKRKAIRREDQWLPLVLYGLTDDDLAEHLAREEAESASV
jgi:hypothetical protein